jgi:hypothetical protein
MAFQSTITALNDQTSNCFLPELHAGSAIPPIMQGEAVFFFTVARRLYRNWNIGLPP